MARTHRRHNRRRNPAMRRNPRVPNNLRMPLIVGGAIVLGASGVFGNSVKSALSTVGNDIRSTLGGHVSSSGGSVTVSATASQPDNIGQSGVFNGNAGTLVARAQAEGIRSAGDPRADKYGAALWSHQGGQPQSAFYQQPVSVRATFDAVATGN